jgi:hypothetical protein
LKVWQYALAKEGKEHELVKDVLAMANAWGREPADIMIGVEEGMPHVVRGEDNHPDDRGWTPSARRARARSVPPACRNCSARSTGLGGMAVESVGMAWIKSSLVIRGYRRFAPVRQHRQYSAAKMDARDPTSD